ncbi:unnamed protein product [Adineta ricciae]|uniref:ZBR-type domain-containing protein n=1 Tax=Adineta ricciae TaxID=249248 RepID=A0A816EYQ9_ADIRI|nr:unnamed protein product [Adineta ricciae]CAF1655808.1 unnamed protein product [Adineta ricciae]
MSSYDNDENIDSYNDSLDSQLDSGYLTFNSSCTSLSYLTSPTRLSPSHVTFNQIDSPFAEQYTNPIDVKFLSIIDYENYRTTRKHFDILTQLSHRNAYHLIDEVLKYLSTVDLNQSLNVCKTWSIIVSDYLRRKQTKTVKRNLFNDQDVKIINAPMHPITNLNSPTTQRVKLASKENDNHLTASSMTFRYGYLKYLHGPTVTKRCPLCGFVSVVDTNDQHGICTNPLCQNSFCQYCSGPYHPSSPCKTTIGPIKSPWRQRSSISPIFSNKTRNNLRRLLIR